MGRKVVELTRNNAQALKCKFYKDGSGCAIIKSTEALICNMKWCTLYLPKTAQIEKPVKRRRVRNGK